jgi:hypothetical protein
MRTHLIFRSIGNSHNLIQWPIQNNHKPTYNTMNALANAIQKSTMQAGRRFASVAARSTPKPPLPVSTNKRGESLIERPNVPF